MNLGAIFISLALLALVITFILDPFRERQRQMFANTLVNNSRRESSSKDALFALRDLEFDYQTDKITEEDYQHIRSGLLAQAAESIKSRQGEDARVEALIRIRRSNQSVESNCPQCNRAFRDEDKFCPECGRAR